MKSVLIVLHEGKEHRVPDVRRCSMKDGWLTLYDDNRNSVGCIWLLLFNRHQVRGCPQVATKERKLNKFKVVTYYDREDEEFEGDYRDVVLFVNNKPVIRFGDDYHDRAFHTCEGYCRSLIDMGHCREVEYFDQHLPKKNWQFFEGKLHQIRDVLN